MQVISTGSTKYMCHNGVPSNAHMFKPCGVEGKKKKKVNKREGEGEGEGEGERGRGTRGERREIKVIFLFTGGILVFAALVCASWWFIIVVNMYPDLPLPRYSPSILSLFLDILPLSSPSPLSLSPLPLPSLSPLSLSPFPFDLIYIGS